MTWIYPHDHSCLSVWCWPLPVFSPLALSLVLRKPLAGQLQAWLSRHHQVSLCGAILYNWDQRTNSICWEKLKEFLGISNTCYMTETRKQTAYSGNYKWLSQGWNENMHLSTNEITALSTSIWHSVNVNVSAFLLYLIVAVYSLGSQRDFQILDNIWITEKYFHVIHDT